MSAVAENPDQRREARRQQRQDSAEDALARSTNSSPDSIVVNTRAILSSDPSKQTRTRKPAISQVAGRRDEAPTGFGRGLVRCLGFDGRSLRSLLNQRRTAARCSPSEWVGQLPLLIIPAPTVTPEASSMRMNEPVVRFLE